MSSRRYSLPSLKNGGIKFGFGGLGGMGFGSSSSKKKSEYPSHHNQMPSSFFASTRHHDKFFRGPSGSSPSSPINASDAKVVHLKRVMQSIHPGHCRLLPGHQQLFHIFGNRRVDRLNSKIDCDEVYPNMLIGNEGAAKNKAYLKLIGVTHVLNCAEGVHFCQINTGSYFYSDHNIKYMGLNILDVPQAKISIHFQETADFIERALMGGGKVLVHCMVGLSRSATIVLAYLMIKRGLSLEEALRTVRRHREIRPNDGFLRQLIELEYTLSTSSNYGVPIISSGIIPGGIMTDPAASSFTSSQSSMSSSMFYPNVYGSSTTRFYSTTSLR